MSSSARAARVGLAGLAVLGLVACAGDSSDDGTTTSEIPWPLDPPSECEGCVGDRIDEPLALDVLFVVDGSRSMAEEQARLIAALPALAPLLEGPGVRIAVTSADVGNPLCPPDQTTPEGGALIAESCRARISAGDFLDDSVDPPIDASALCTSVCPYDQIDLLPTWVAGDGEARPRPWIDVNGALSNLPDGVSALDALACFLPQGVRSCAYASPLEASYRALARSADPGDPAYGFLRPYSRLLVVILSDAADCSLNPAHGGAFVESEPFWPDLDAPTPAICWRAGVECAGPGPVYEGCDPVDRGDEGGPVEAGPAAVLYPVDRYLERFQELHYDRQLYSSSPMLAVLILAGVPAGYPEAPLIYSSEGDPAFVAERGIGPGCSGSGGPAAPPVRLRSLVDAEVDEWSAPWAFMGSICDDAYDGPLAEVTELLRRDQIGACVPECVADQDSTTPLLETDCVYRLVNIYTGEQVDLARCERKDGVWAPPGGEGRCYVERVDREGLTPDPADDLSPRCREWSNVEVELLEWVPRPPGTELYGRCELSWLPEIDCPFYE
ncbi:MAG: hypothetical protein H6710_11880 [Myxococcales bacterium]|nr:hypothetical protein [Myxococcales bacterium]MCB9700333.1 hypothetical protein [Myxococcales bacterium]